MRAVWFFLAVILGAGAFWAADPAVAKSFVQISSNKSYWVDMDSRQLRADGRTYFCGAYKDEQPQECDEDGGLYVAMDCANRHFYAYAPDPTDDDSPRFWQQDDSQVSNGNLYDMICRD